MADYSVSRTKAEIVESSLCPQCGCKSLHYWSDPNGSGGQCRETDCLGFFDFDELVEHTEETFK